MAAGRTKRHSANPGSGARVSWVKLLICIVPAAALVVVIYFAWGWGRIEYLVQRLGGQDRELAESSELELLALGENGRNTLYSFLIKKLGIELPTLTFESEAEFDVRKVIAVSRAGEVEVAGATGCEPSVALLADADAPVEILCRPLCELVRAGAVRALAVVLSPGDGTADVVIGLEFLDSEKIESYPVLRVDKTSADLEGVAVTNPSDLEPLLKGGSPRQVRLVPAPGVQYARLLKLVCWARAAGRWPVLVFGDAQAFGVPSVGALEQLTRGLAATDEAEQVRAALRLKKAMGDLFAYDPAKSPDENRAAIEEWRKWFEKNSRYIYFDTVQGMYAYDAAAAAVALEHKEYWLKKLRIEVKDSTRLQERKEGKR